MANIQPKILHLIAGSLNRGAARGAYWLHRALLDIGVDSVVLTNSRETFNDPSVISLNQTFPQRLKYFLLPKLGNLPVQLYRNRKQRLFNTGFDGSDISHHPAYQHANIIHLHWISGLVSVRSLRQIEKPLVWTIRDMWPFTGGCHYSMECEQYRTGCGRCVQLGSHSVLDLSRAVVRNKRGSLPKHLKVVGISEWISECAKQSHVFNGYSIETISNAIDTNQFFPVDKTLARDILDLDQKKKIVLVGAQQLFDFYKGFDAFLNSLKFLMQSNIHLLFFGRIEGHELEQLPYSYTNLGFLSDSVSLRLAYSAADVFVAPSRMDAFGKTLVEAMACGTPVICFDATGPQDIVMHKQTGYRAQPFDPEDLARGIQWVLDRPEVEYKRLVEEARARTVSLFDTHVIAKQYLAFYKQLL